MTTLSGLSCSSVFTEHTTTLSTQVQPHRRLVMSTMARAVPMAVESFQQYFNYMLGMLDLFTLPGHYILDWVEIFYSRVFIQSDRSRIMFMFEGERHVLYRSDIAAALRLQESDIRLHDLVYPDIPPSRRPVCTGVDPPDFDTVSICFEEPFGPASPRHPSDLTRLASIALKGLRRSLLPRTGNRETVTALQQWILSYILRRQPFDIVDFLICEIEDVAAEGLTVSRMLPYAHIICYLLARSFAPIDEHLEQWTISPTGFPNYRPARPGDRCRGQRVLAAVQQQWAPEQREQFLDEDKALRQAEVQAGLEGIQTILSSEDLSEDDSSDAEFVIPDATPF
ncbi:hypothetical protein C2845_PM04G04340 [Panicum miliaceum]|uniref:Uncharacterized protein n=1 Tax=Panicum miliaceum TaxID=4540 RepID=A0A3L6QQ18_PANMI|nr:hypothetical protein C2845_PM04G04340 [Panicum miliaceum]